MAKCAQIIRGQLLIVGAVLASGWGAFGQTTSNVPPSVVLTDPPAWAAFNCSSRIFLAATATDLDGAVERVEFYFTTFSLISTNYLGSVTQAPYQLTLADAYPFCSVPGIASQVFDLTAVAEDNEGARSTSAPVKIYFPQSLYGPEVTITQPKGGDVFSALESVTITATVKTYYGSVRTNYFMSDGILIGTATNLPYTLTTHLPPGEHALTARYVDEGGNVGISPPIHITIQPFSLLSARFLGAGQFGFTIQGLVTGNWFQVETSSNLLNWFPLLTNTAASNTFIYSEPVSPSAPKRFYRAVQAVP